MQNSPASVALLLAAVLVATQFLGGCGASGDAAENEVPLPATDVVIIPESFYPGVTGTNRIRGTVTLPASEVAGTRVRLTVINGAYTFRAVGAMLTAGTAATFMVEGVAPGSYSITVEVDGDNAGGFADGNDSFGSPPAAVVVAPGAGIVTVATFTLTAIPAGAG